MVNHGVSTGMLFLLFGVIYDRRHTRNIDQFGGLTKPMPVYATLFMVATLASIGLPGTNGFIGEFLIMLGAYLKLRLAVVFAVFGIILGALYMLYAYERVMFGPITKAVNETLADLNWREIGVLIPLIALMLFMGLYPRPLLTRMEPSVNAMLNRVKSAQARLETAPRPAALAALAPAARAGHR